MFAFSLQKKEGRGFGRASPADIAADNCGVHESNRQHKEERAKQQEGENMATIKNEKEKE